MAHANIPRKTTPRKTASMTWELGKGIPHTILTLSRNPFCLRASGTMVIVPSGLVIRFGSLTSACRSQTATTRLNLPWAAWTPVWPLSRVQVCLVPGQDAAQTRAPNRGAGRMCAYRRMALGSFLMVIFIQITPRNSPGPGPGLLFGPARRATYPRDQAFTAANDLGSSLHRRRQPRIGSPPLPTQPGPGASPLPRQPGIRLPACRTHPRISPTMTKKSCCVSPSFRTDSLK